MAKRRKKIRVKEIERLGKTRIAAVNKRFDKEKGKNKAEQ